MKYFLFYTSTGQDFGTDHVLLLNDDDIEWLRGKHEAGQKLLVDTDFDEVSQHTEVGTVYEAVAGDNEAVEEIVDACMDLSGGALELTEKQAGLLTARLDKARTEGDSVQVNKYLPDCVQLEWRAKHVDGSSYYVSVNLKKEEEA